MKVVTHRHVYKKRHARLRYRPTPPSDLKAPREEWGPLGEVLARLGPDTTEHSNPLDAETAGMTFCPSGHPCEYRGLRDASGRYHALAVCSRCSLALEF